MVSIVHDVIIHEDYIIEPRYNSVFEKNDLFFIIFASFL